MASRLYVSLVEKTWYLHIIMYLYKQRDLIQASPHMGPVPSPSAHKQHACLLGHIAALRDHCGSSDEVRKGTCTIMAQLLRVLILDTPPLAAIAASRRSI